MEHKKTDIKELVAKGKLAAATDMALEYAEYCGLADMANALISVRAQTNDHEQKWISGVLSYEDYSLSHARITNSLVHWVDRLPDIPKPAALHRKFLTEAIFKKRLFYLLLSIKAIVLMRLAYHYSTGGFTSDQFQGTTTLLAPALAVYITVILADYLRQQKSDSQPPRYISGPLVTFAYWLFPIYAMLLLLFIELKVKGTISFTGMNSWLALVESVLGGYIGQMVHSLFKE